MRYISKILDENTVIVTDTYRETAETYTLEALRNEKNTQKVMGFMGKSAKEIRDVEKEIQNYIVKQRLLGENYDGFKFYIEDFGACIMEVPKRCLYLPSKLVVPYFVDEIDFNMGYNRLYLESVELPFGLKMIHSNSFMGAVGLKRIVLPDSIDDIGFNAFADCISLEEVELGSGIAELDSSVFDGCINLKPEVCAKIERITRYEYEEECE